MLRHRRFDLLLKFLKAAMPASFRQAPPRKVCGRSGEAPWRRSRRWVRHQRMLRASWAMPILPCGAMPRRRYDGIFEPFSVKQSIVILKCVLPCASADG